MSELALDGPNKDEVPFTVWYKQLSPIPALLVQGLERFPCEKEPGKPVLLTAG